MLRFVQPWYICLRSVFYFIPSYVNISFLIKVRRAGLNVDFAPDPIAYQLNVRNGALILKVNWITGTLLFCYPN